MSDTSGEYRLAKGEHVFSSADVSEAAGRQRDRWRPLLDRLKETGDE